MHRSRSHFLHIIYQYFLQVRGDYSGRNSDQNARIAYMLHNLPSLLVAEVWNEELSAAAWGELEEQSRFKNCTEWLQFADKQAFADEASNYPLSPDGMLKMHKLRQDDK